MATITNIETFAIKTDTVTIRFDSDSAVKCKIDYGTTTSYGNTTPEEKSSYFHSIVIMGLSPGILYNYRVIITDINGIEFTSTNNTFTSRTQSQLDSVIQAARVAQGGSGLPKIYYVSPTGNDSNTGLTLSTPWRNPPVAASRAYAGDTIYLMDGIYYTTGDGIRFSKSGIDVAPIMITAYPGANPIWDGTDATTTPLRFGMYITPGNNMVAYTLDSIVISNITIRNFAQAMQVRYAQNITVENTLQYNVNVPQSYGILQVMDGCRNIKINGNILTAVVGYNSLLVQGSIVTGQMPTYNVAVINNDISGNDKHWAIQAEGTIYNILIANNYTHNNPYRGSIDLYKSYEGQNVYHWVVRDNTINDGNLMMTSAQNGIAENITINNGIFDLYGIYYQGDGLKLENIIIRNSTLSNYPYYNSIEGGQNLTFENINLINFGYYYGRDWQIRGTTGPITFRNLVNFINRFFIRLNANATIEYTDNSIFKFTQGSISGTATTILPIHYPNRSYFSQTTTGTNTSEFTITKYTLYARPSSGSATFTINTSSTLLPNTTYNIKINNIQTSTIITDSNGTASISLTPSTNNIITVVDQSGVIKISLTVASTTGSSILFTFGEAPPPPTTGDISGNVKNSSNANISDATVSDGTRTATTDSSGNFTISNVPVGIYTVTASTTGYVIGILTGIPVTAGFTTTGVNFTLQLSCPIPICEFTLTQL